MKKLLCIMCLTMLILSFALPVSANSAQMFWYGVDSTGAVIVDGESPIVVEHEQLIFDIPEFPSNHYSSEEEFLAYDGKVTAEYTFYNPSDMTVTATLAFPFGNLPGYAQGYSDVDKYNILVNGDEIEAEIRHTLSDSYGKFDIKTDLSLLSDGYVNDRFYNPDLPVTVYQWSIGGIPGDVKWPVHVACDIPKGENGRVYYFPDQNSGHLQDDGDYRIGSFVRKNGQSIILYVFGEPLSALPEWKFYKDGGAEDEERINGTATFGSKETMRFEDFAFRNYDEESGVSKTDWYNAVIAEINSDATKYSNYPIVDLYRYESHFNGYLMRWYKYNVTLDAKEKLVNSVTAPIYPNIDMTYVPTVNKYTYLLSPASSWAEFGNLDIEINTPYYVTESSLGDFEKTDGGYRMNLKGLPEGELIFSLSTEENPTPRSKTPQGIMKNIVYFLAFFGLPIIVGIAIITLITVVVVLIVKRKR